MLWWSKSTKASRGAKELLIPVLRPDCILSFVLRTEPRWQIIKHSCASSPWDDEIVQLKYCHVLLEELNLGEQSQVVFMLLELRIQLRSSADTVT